MPDIILYVENNNTLTSRPLPYVAESPAANGTIVAKFADVPKAELVLFLAPSLEGKLYAFPLPSGKRHSVTNLRAEGNFKLVPQFK